MCPFLIKKRFLSLFDLIVCNEPLQPFDGDAFIHISPAAVIFTGPDADPPQDSGQAGRPPDGGKGFLEPPFFDQLDIMGNRKVGGASALTGCGHLDFILLARNLFLQLDGTGELVFKMIDRIQHRLRTRLPQVTFGTFTDHLTKIFQLF